MSIKAKIVFENDIRLWRCPQQNLYESLVSFVKTTFNFPNEKCFHLQYEDDEGDRVTISCEIDILDAISMANGDDRKSLKIYVAKETDQSPNETAEKSGESIVEEKSTAKVTTNENNKNCNPDVCTLNRDVVLQFLKDETIKNLLPDFIKDIMTGLRKDQSLEKVLPEILKDKKYLPITSHELFRNFIEKNLSLIIQRGQSYVPIVLTFSEDFVISRLPSLIDCAIEAASAFNNVDCEFFFDPSWNGVFKCFSQCGDCNDNKNEETIHRNVSCDICNVTPIHGVRYKCAICPNFDLCSKCEAQGNHEPSHPLIKLIKPFTGFPPAHFLGIHELFRPNMNHPHPHGSSGLWFGPPPPPPGAPMHPMFSQRCPYRSRRSNGGSPKCGSPKNKCGYWRRRSSDKSSDNDRAVMDAQFICDVNLPDGAFCPVDTIMTKIWKMKNNTSVEWGDNVELVFIKGNESLTLEKRFPVPNVKPGEEVEVKAMIRTPKIPGRYCAYYRLTKNGNKFGARVWVDVNAVEDAPNKEEKAEQITEKIVNNKNEKSNGVYEVLCVCGVPLILTTPSEAYRSVDVRVYCDGCSKNIEPRGSVFHCLNEKSSQHPNCYDLCLKCAEAQMRLIESKSSPIIENVENKEIEKIASPVSLPIPQPPVVQPVPSAPQPPVQPILVSQPPVVQPVPQQPQIAQPVRPSQQNPESGNNSWGDKIIDSVKSFVNELSPKDEKFPFPDQLKMLVEMGFDEKKAKASLLKHNGNVSDAVNELF